MDAGKFLKRALRQWTFSLAPESRERLAALPVAANEYGVDPFGMELDYILAAVAPFVWLYKHYFRVEVHGLKDLPPGRLLFAANHGGQLPFDGAMIGIALMLEGNPPRAVRSMVDNWVPSLPFVSTFMARCGQVVGTPENCRRLLLADQTILVFPEGMRGISKLYRDRYQLQRFGHGFMRLAMETNTPVVPVAVVGAEEQSPAVADLKPLANLLGLPSLPLTPTLLPLPLPVKYRIAFGEPLQVASNNPRPAGPHKSSPGVDDPVDDEAQVERRVALVRASIESLLKKELAARTHVFW